MILGRFYKKLDDFGLLLLMLKLRMFIKIWITFDTFEQKLVTHKRVFDYIRLKYES